MPVPIAELFVSVSADVTAAANGLTSLGNQLNKTTQQFQAAAPAATLLAGAGAAIGAGFALSVKTAADFEHQMSGVKAVMTPDEVNTFGAALTDLALKLGRDTVFTSREAAAGIEELIKAGIPAADVLGGAAQAAVDLAAATGTPVANAATIASQAMNAFHISASGLSGVVNTLAGAANATAADVTGLQQGLQVVGTTANGLGLSFADTVTALGLFVSAGETGANAGTGLRQMLLELTPTTKPARDEMLKLGLTTRDGGNAFFDATGHIKSMADISGVLQKALSGMSQEQRTAALNTLFTRDAINSAQILAGTGAAGFNQLTTAIGQISAADAAKTRLDNLQGALQNLGGSVETVQIIVGDFFLPVLRGLAEAVRGPLDAFSSMSPAARQVATAIVGLVGGISGLLGGVVLLSPIINAIGPAFLSVGRVLLSLVPLFRVAALAAGALAVAWSTNLLGIRDIVQTAFDSIPTVLEFISGKFSEAGKFWEETVVPALQTISDAISGPLGNALVNVRGGLDQFVSKFGEIAAAIKNSAIGQAIQTQFDSLGSIFQQIISGHGQEVIDFFKDRLPEPFKNLGSALEGPVSNAFGFISSVFQAIIDGRGQGVIEFFKTSLPQPLKDLGATVAGPLNSTFGFISNVFQAIITGHGQEVLDFFKNNLPDAFQQAGKKVEGLGPTFGNLGAFLGGLAAVLVNLDTDKLTAFAATFGGTFAESFSKFGNQLTPLIPVFTAIGGFAGSLNNLIQTVRGLGSAQGGADAGDAVVSPLQRLVDFVRDNAGLADFTTFLGPIGQAFKLFRDNAEGIAEFFNTLSTALDGFAAAIKKLDTAPPDWLLTLLNKGLIGGALAAGADLGVATSNANSIGSATPSQTAFNPNAPFGQGSGGGNVFITGPVNVSDGSSLEEFLATVANAVNNATRRVNPPVPTGQPSLVGGTI